MQIVRHALLVLALAAVAILAVPPGLWLFDKLMRVLIVPYLRYWLIP